MSIWKSIRLRVLPKPFRRLLNHGSARFCVICGSSLRGFRSFGVPSAKPRIDAQCPVCYSLERHRLVWSYFTNKTDLFDGKPKRLLHVAPEPQLSRLLRRVPGLDYLSIDLEKGKAMMSADITNLPFKDKQFDVIYCSHVLEHVPEDRKAMAEFRRVLRPDGWAILLVPIRGEVTFEDSSVTSPEERERLFGQWDHVRIYGSDYVTRLREAGFKVRVDSYSKEFQENEIARMGIDRQEDIFFCRS